MNSIDDIWQSIVDRLAQELTPVAIDTWFSDCQPIELGDKRLVLQTSTDFKKNIILQRFSAAIKKALFDLFSCEFDLLVLVGDEIIEYEREDQPDDIIPEALAYTFDRFIVGSSNKFAHAAAIAVSENPGTVYNPLFIYGNSGLGKTHLLLAIGQAIREKNPAVSIGYIKGDDFTNQLIQSIQNGTVEDFRKRYRNVDLFLVDDVQFIAGKERTQEEFFHTFNNIYEAGHQIVITSDRPPMELLNLEDRLRTRFEGGLMADVQPPDLETRIAIIRNKAQLLGLLLPDEVVNFIAENITTNIRQIEGVIHRLTAYRQIEGDSMTVSSVKRAIKDVIHMGVYVPTAEVIIAETGRFYDCSESDIRGQRRTKNLSTARQVAMYLMRCLTNTSLIDIGHEFENRNHSTVLASIRKIEKDISTDPNMAKTIREITSNINAVNSR